jgi:hypothetical protein
VRNVRQAIQQGIYKSDASHFCDATEENDIRGILAYYMQYKRDTTYVFNEPEWG